FEQWSSLTGTSHQLLNVLSIGSEPMDDSVLASLNQVWVFLWEVVKDRYDTVPLRRCLSEYSLQSVITIDPRSNQRLHLIKNNKTLYTYAFLVWLLWRCWH